MILDGSKGWYWCLKSLPERVREHDATVSFYIIEREIGDKFNAKSMMVDDSTIIGYDIMDADTLLGILFDKSLKSDEGNFLWICAECHSQIHALFSNYELKELYNTKEKLMEEPRMRKKE